VCLIEDGSFEEHGMVSIRLLTLSSSALLPEETSQTNEEELQTENGQTLIRTGLGQLTRLVFCSLPAALRGQAPQGPVMKTITAHNPRQPYS
jgi:hypothetical protein